MAKQLGDNCLKCVERKEIEMSIEIKAWKCEKCGKAWLDKSFADDCCKEKEPNKCRVCGCEVKSPWLICPECREKERFEKAKKIKYSEYKVGCLWDERTEEYYSDKEELEEEYYNNAYDEGIGPEYPTWCYGCIEIPFKIDIKSAIERAEENMYEDFEAEKSAVDLQELLDFVKDWNQKQAAKTYTVDYKTVVLLNE